MPGNLLRRPKQPHLLNNRGVHKVFSLVGIDVRRAKGQETGGRCRCRRAGG